MNIMVLSVITLVWLWQSFAASREGVLMLRRLGGSCHLKSNLSLLYFTQVEHLQCVHS